MDVAFKQEFIDGYKADTKYASTIEALTDGAAKASGGVFSKHGCPFEYINSLLYNIRPDGTRSLYIPRPLVKQLLALAYNEKHYFGRDKMLYNLRGLLIR